MKIVKKLKNLILWLLFVPVVLILSTTQYVARCAADIFESFYRVVDEAGNALADLVSTLVGADSE